MPSHKTVVRLKDDGILQKAATTTLGGRELALARRDQQPSWLQRMFSPGPLLLLWLSGPQLILPLPQSQVLPLPWALGLLVAEVPRLSKILICRTQGLGEEPSIPRITYMRAVRKIVKGKQWTRRLNEVLNYFLGSQSTTADKDIMRSWLRLTFSGLRLGNCLIFLLTDKAFSSSFYCINLYPL